MQGWWYQQFDADHARDVPAESYGGWKKGALPVEIEKSALVCMHAWDAGTSERYPGWWRCVDYIPRAVEIGRTVFPPLLSAWRASGRPLFHVVGGGDYYKDLPGYRRAVELAGPPPAPPVGIAPDDHLRAIQTFRSAHVHVGAHNQADVQAGFQALNFQAEAFPEGDEGIAENGHQLIALCKEADVRHLIYMGFAINWCLLLSPGGMWDMSQRGVACSAIRQATSAVESNFSARFELAKELGLWRVALAFGFVFDVDDVLAELGQHVR